jgi:UDP-glucose:(heptosyl)LPS alpha-1,3-glucosyltransferase
MKDSFWPRPALREGGPRKKADEPGVSLNDGRLSALRILISMPIFEMARGGAEDFGYRLCTRLSGLGHEVHVITDRGVEVPGIKVTRPISSLKDVIRGVRPDLHMDWGLNHPADLHRLGGGAHRSFLAHSLNAYGWGLHWYKHLRNLSPRNRRIIRRQEELLRRPGARFIVNSRFAEGQIIISGASPKAVTVLHNGVDTAFFRPAPGDKKAVALRRSWGIGPEECAALFVAHNLVLKNFSLMRKVLDRLKATVPGLRLVVVGKRRPARMPSNAIYAGELKDMTSCYRAADLLVHPTFFDSCANVVLEAMSSGLPVAVSDVCGANELVEDGVSGYVMPVTGNSGRILDEWCGKIELLAGSREARLKMGESARQAMLKNDLGLYVERLEAILKEILLEKKGNLQDRP